MAGAAAMRAPALGGMSRRPRTGSGVAAGVGDGSSDGRPLPTVHVRAMCLAAIPAPGVNLAADAPGGCAAKMIAGIHSEALHTA